MKVNSLKHDSPEFPKSLKLIDRPPRQLYWTGQPLSAWAQQPKLAVVGIRKPTSYGASVTNRLVTEMASYGVVIISGLAYGIDSLAHKAALAAGGVTVAILPTSLQKIYPAAHLNLSRQIAESGSLISEYGPTDPIYKANFIERNRIVSGLSDGVLITEAAARSGTLSTARFALEQGKTVMVVPGNIDSPNSQGCNNLIKSGALPITEPADIFFAMRLKPVAPRDKVAFRGSAREESVLALIADGLTNQEELAVKSNLTGAEIASVLISLELAGRIKPVGGGQWILS